MFVIATPGSKYGPCQKCAHAACLRQVEIATSICYLCSQMIGYRTAFCCDADSRTVHLACANAEVQRQCDLAGIAQVRAVTTNRPLVFNKQEAAEILRIGVSTINEMIANDQISRVKIGTRILFTPEQLLSFLKRREVLCRSERAIQQR